MPVYDVRFDGPYGVMDHNHFEARNGDGGIAFHNGGASGVGDEEWNNADRWGTANFMYVEDSLFSNHSLGDAHDGGRYVFRHNTISAADKTAPQMYNHGVTDSRGRSMRAAEMYLNTITETYPVGVNQPTESPNGGTLLYWGNTVSGYTSAVGLGYTCRPDSTGCNYGYANPPSGWGHCGTLHGPSAWDGNQDSSGYPCMDQPGRGAGDLLSGSFPRVCNQTLGCSTFNGQWPRQALSPIYVWNNTFTPAAGYSGVGLVGNQISMIAARNRDWYQQFGAHAESGSFNGTVGVGQGTLVPTQAGAYPNAPDCTAGPGGNAPGVGYWNTTNNTLYVCTATNTWTAYYTPYVYPHPLAGGASSANAPAPPTVLVATVT
jgi:hypothetical protein